MVLGMIVVITPFLLARLLSVMNVKVAVVFLIVTSIAFPFGLYFYAMNRFPASPIYLVFAFYSLAPIIALIYLFSKDTRE